MYGYNKTLLHTGDVSEAILTPLASFVTLVLLGSTKSGSGGGRLTPANGVSRRGRALELSPVSQLKMPPEAGFVAAALTDAYLVDPTRP